MAWPASPDRCVPGSMLTSPLSTPIWQQEPPRTSARRRWCRHGSAARCGTSTTDRARQTRRTGGHQNTPQGGLVHHGRGDRGALGALLENVIAGPHKSDVASIRPKLEIPSALGSVAGMRIALSPNLGCYNVDADVLANTMAAADRLRDAGATVTEVSLPWDLESIARTVIIHFGMIFGASMQ